MERKRKQPYIQSGSHTVWNVDHCPAASAKIGLVRPQSQINRQSKCPSGISRFLCKNYQFINCDSALPFSDTQFPTKSVIKIIEDCRPITLCWTQIAKTSANRWKFAVKNFDTNQLKGWGGTMHFTATKSPYKSKRCCAIFHSCKKTRFIY